MNTQKKRFTLISIFTLLSLCPSLQAQIDNMESGRFLHVIQPGEIPQGLSSKEWGKIQQQVKQAQYQPYSDKKGGYRSANPAHGWQIHYASDGTTTLTPRNQPIKPYTLGMKLSAIGYQTLQTLKSPEIISQKDFTVTYQWGDNLREWWVNSDQQLEQWFVLQHKPEGDDNQHPLTLQMILQSELKAELKRNTLTFTDKAGTNISYKKLKVWDAQGKTIPAQMQLAGNTLSLLVNDQQAEYPLTIDPSFTQQDYVTASTIDDKDRFGHSVAISGDTLVVGAYLEDSDSTGIDGNESNNLADNSGAVYVYTRLDDSSWERQAYIKASNAMKGDYFGYSVAISGDTLVVGAHREDTEGRKESNDSGAAYVFMRDGSGWQQKAYLKASNTGSKDHFARSVAISGNTLVVGAINEDSNSTGINGSEGNDDSGSLSGAAYVFTLEEESDSWEQEAYLKASNTAKGDHFGWSVAISGDTLVVGAHHQGNNSGAAYVFNRTESSWEQQAYLKASNTESGDAFGHSVGIFGDTLVVGAAFESSNSTGIDGDQSNNLLQESGAAYVFTRIGSSWEQNAYLKASNTGNEDRFGYAVAIVDNTLIVGARYEDSESTGVNGDETNPSEPDSGAAYVFTRSGSSWNQSAYLKSSTIGPNRFGHSVAISGGTMVVGASLDDDDNQSISASGGSYLFTVIPPHILPDNQWHQISLPMNPKDKNTVTDIFGDDGLGTYDTNWVVYSFNSTNYVKLAPTDTLKQGVGYWIFQNTGSEKTLEMPVGSATTPISPSEDCFGIDCFSIPLATEAGADKYTLLGYPYGKSQPLSETRIHADIPACNDPNCELSDAEADGIFHNQLWSYDGSTDYNLIMNTDNLDPWLGYWGKTLNAADGTNPVLMIPKP
jgi:hypothetical protein